MQANCILRSGLLFATLSLVIAKHKQSSSAKGCYPRGTLSQAVDRLYVKAAWLKATIPKNCRFQEQLLSFFMDDVFGQLQLQVCKERHFVEEFHSLRQQLSRCKPKCSLMPGTRFIVLLNQRPCEPQSCKLVLALHSLIPSLNKHLISCASSAREMKTITRMKRTFYGIGNKGIYKAVSELDILLSWIKQFLESIK
ncbi:interleukin-26 isoform X2 [Neofelis nebulosa]|uniref:interleukin-26 isoform X2 n=1 Tax=Neofelis nebulosa TaxID=61452 RepID=UPI00272C6DE8|nr:interleukin-26 isoform X2 [Neofelis nebulosa]